MGTRFGATELDEGVIQEERRKLIGDRLPIKVIAQINDQSERAVYDNIQRHQIPFLLVGSMRYIDPRVYAEMRAHRVRPEPQPLPAPRRVGRPRKPNPLTT
jgi:hypothetical protein